MGTSAEATDDVADDTAEDDGDWSSWEVTEPTGPGPNINDYSGENALQAGRSHHNYEGLSEDSTESADGGTDGVALQYELGVPQRYGLPPLVGVGVAFVVRYVARRIVRNVVEEVAGGAPVLVERLPQDVNVNPEAPAPLPTTRPIGKSPTQNAAAQAQVREWQAKGYEDIRVDQQQVNAAGERVGVNRPDLQGTNPVTGQREYVEYETSQSDRGPGHEARTLANDPAGKSSVRVVD